MKTEKVVKVVISEDDIKNLIHNELRKKRLIAKSEIHIRIGSRYEGYGMSESEVHYIDDTLIECTEE